MRRTGHPQKQVNSPTFAFVNEYQGRFLVLHLDLYRIDDVSAGLDVGIMDYLARAEKGVAMIEWADKVLPLLPDDRLVVQFNVLSTQEASTGTDRPRQEVRPNHSRAGSLRCYA